MSSYLFLRIFCASLLTILLSACGVKGKPQPPLTAPILGRGEPNYSKTTENVKLKKKPKTSDWDEPGDFPEEQGQ
jgi:hypothetical protein